MLTSWSRNAVQLFRPYPHVERNFFFSECGYRPHVADVFGIRVYVWTIKYDSKIPGYVWTKPYYPPSGFVHDLMMCFGKFVSVTPNAGWYPATVKLTQGPRQEQCTVLANNYSAWRSDDYFIMMTAQQVLPIQEQGEVECGGRMIETDNNTGQDDCVSRTADPPSNWVVSLPSKKHRMEAAGLRTGRFHTRIIKQRTVKSLIQGNCFHPAS